MLNARDVHEPEHEKLPEEDEEVDTENDDLESEEDDEEELEPIQVLPDRRLDTWRELPNLGFGHDCADGHGKVRISEDFGLFCTNRPCDQFVECLSRDSYREMRQCLRISCRLPGSPATRMQSLAAHVEWSAIRRSGTRTTVL